MNPIHDFLNQQTRRQFFAGAGLAMGGLALHSLAPRARAAAAPARVHPPLPGFPHFAPTAKRIIYLHMNGGPSQLDTFDYKPKLTAMSGQDLPESVRAGQRITTMTSGQANFPLAPSLFKFAQHGESGFHGIQFDCFAGFVAGKQTDFKGFRPHFAGCRRRKRLGKSRGSFFRFRTVDGVVDNGLRGAAFDRNGRFYRFRVIRHVNHWPGDKITDA